MNEVLPKVGTSFELRQLCQLIQKQPGRHSLVKASKPQGQFPPLGLRLHQPGCLLAPLETSTMEQGGNNKNA